MNIGNAFVKGSLVHISTSVSQLASGSTAQRPLTANAGSIRFNTDLGKYEGFSDPKLTGTLGWYSMNDNAVTVSGSGITSSFSNSTVTLSLTGELPALSAASGTGLMIKNNGTYSAVSLAASATNGQQGLVVGNPDGTSGNPTIGLSLSTLTSTANSISGANYFPYYDGSNNLKATFSQLLSYVSNSLSSSYTYTGGTGITVTGQVISGNYVGGTGISVTGNSIALSSPVSVLNGGTGSTTASGALTNLGAVPLAGGTMSGLLTLSANPTALLGAATKQYVDTNITANAYTAGASGALTLTSRAFSVNTSGTSIGISANALIVRSTSTAGQVLTSTGTAGTEATWGALNLALSAAITGALSVTNGGTGATTAAAARTNLSAAGVYRTTFTSASLTAGVLTVTHSLGNQFVQVIIYDNSNKMIIPDEITMTSTTVSSVDLSSFVTGMTGTWNVVVVG